MSSTISRFQTPVHAYGQPQREPQQPYFNHEFGSYSADSSRSLADNANSYPHAENLYHQGCSYVPYGPEHSELEEAEETIVYDPLQNHSYTSPQLLSPRPSLPPSQFSPPFSWYDWQSEAPANVYQAERSRCTSTNLIAPHTPQPEGIQASFGNRQYTSKFSALPEYVPNPSYVADGYQPFVGPEPTGAYVSVHQPVAPEQRSTYSELAPNLTFLNSQSRAKTPRVRKEPSHTRNLSTPKPKNDGAIPRGTIASPDIEKNPFALGFDGPPLTAFGRKVQKTPRPVSLPAPLKPSKSKLR